MLRYIVKRLLIFVPTLFAISLLTFVISANAPGDPVAARLERDIEDQLQQRVAKQQAYAELRTRLGLDRPIFYFTLTTATQPDTLHRIPMRSHRQALEELAFEHGNWPAVQRIRKALLALEQATYTLSWNTETQVPIRSLREKAKLASTLHTLAELQHTGDAIAHLVEESPVLQPLKKQADALQEALQQLEASPQRWRQWIPRFHWYGANNQYHLWLFGDKPFFGDGPGKRLGVVRGDFGISYHTLQPVGTQFKRGLRWTVLLSMISLLVAFASAIPLGVVTAVKRGTWIERFIATKLFVLYSLPNFWVATLLLIYFAGGDYFDWFPTYGLGDLPDSAPFWDRFWETLWHLVLPVVCWTYASLAFISRQMRTSMLNSLSADYVRTARAKGLSERKVIWRHAFRNSLLNMITMLAIVLPRAVAGSIVIEHIFTIPGTGELTLTAYGLRDYPVIYSATLLAGAITLVGTLLADVLYAVADPRITFVATTDDE